MTDTYFKDDEESGRSYGAAILLLLAKFHERNKSAIFKRMIAKTKSCNQERLSRPVTAPILEILPFSLDLHIHTRNNPVQSPPRWLRFLKLDMASIAYLAAPYLEGTQAASDLITSRLDAGGMMRSLGCGHGRIRRSIFPRGNPPQKPLLRHSSMHRRILDVQVQYIETSNITISG